MAVQRTPAGGGQQKPQELIETGYGKPKTGGAFLDGGGGGMSGPHQIDPAKKGVRNTPGENNPFNKADPWADLSPAKQVEFDYKKSVAHGDDLRDAAQERMKAFPDYGQVDEKGNLVGWDKLDEQYMPDQRTVANPANTEFENETALNPENSMPEGALMAFDSSGNISASASSTVEASGEADSITGSMGSAGGDIGGGSFSGGGEAA